MVIRALTISDFEAEAGASVKRQNKIQSSKTHLTNCTLNFLLSTCCLLFATLSHRKRTIQLCALEYQDFTGESWIDVRSCQLVSLTHGVRCSHHPSTQNICRQPSAALYFYDAYPPLSSAINLRSMHYDGPLKHGCKCALCTQSCGEACQLPKSEAKIRRVHFVAPLQKHAEDTSYKIQVWLVLITTGPN